MRLNSRKKGFTLIELLVTISVTILLSGLLIGYTRTGEKQITLVTEQAKMVGIILRAKTLAIQASKEQAAPCGYGVNFVSPTEYILFKKPKLPVGCDDPSNKRYANPANEKIQSFVLESGINISSINPSLQDIFFLPPDPKVFFDGQEPALGAEAVITLSADNISLAVHVNRVGQITTH